MKEIFTVVSLTKIHEFWGESPSNFAIQLHVEIRSSRTKGGEAFAATVMSPAQLEQDMKTAPREIETGRGIIFMLDYDENEVLKYFQNFISALAASNWSELAQRVSSYFNWID